MCYVYNGITINLSSFIVLATLLLLEGDKMQIDQSHLFLLKRHDIQLVSRKKTLQNKIAPFVA